MKNERWKARRLCWILRWGACLLIGVLSACKAANGQEAVELSRSVSPDSLVDAVLIRDNVHATTPYVYRVYLVPHGQARPMNGTERLRADHVEGLVLQWIEPTVLTIQFSKARVFHFSNFWNSREVRDFRHTVELRLLPQPGSAL